MAKAIGKGQTHVDKMDAILTDSHLDTGIKICTMVSYDCTKARILRSMQKYGKGETSW